MIRKILIGIFIFSAIPGIFWGLVTRDAHKGASVYVNTYNYLVQPVEKYLLNKLDRSQNRAINRAEKLQENFPQTSNNQ